MEKWAFLQCIRKSWTLKIILSQCLGDLNILKDILGGFYQDTKPLRWLLKLVLCVFYWGVLQNFQSISICTIITGHDSFARNTGNDSCTAETTRSFVVINDICHTLQSSWPEQSVCQPLTDNICGESFWTILIQT